VVNHDLVRSFLNFVDAHIPEGRLGRQGVGIPRPFANPFRTLWSRLCKSNLPESGKGSSQDNGKRKKVKGKRQNDDKLKQNLYPLTLILGSQRIVGKSF
jgi:hypothetical protein